MTELITSQAIFEKYLARRLSLDEAADALTALILERKAAGGSPNDLSLRKPTGLALGESDVAHADALFAEMDRRAISG
jgi:hypothetical protein